MQPISFIRNRLRTGKYSLKKRMSILFLLSAIIPVVLIGSISYYSISSILNNKIQNSVMNNLKQVKYSLDNTLSNLNHASQQLAFDGRVGRDLAKYLVTTDVFEKNQLANDIQNNLHLIGFTNPNLGLVFYYFSDSKQIVFKESVPSGQFEPERLPVLMQLKDMTYYGPHRTNNRFIDSTVLSVTRKVDVPGYNTLYIYIETSFELAGNILGTEQSGSGMKVTHLVIDDRNRIAYSENDRQYKVGTIFRDGQSLRRLHDADNGNYLFEQEHNQGWKVVAVISETDYNREKNRWIIQFGMFTCLSIGISLFFAWMIWRTMYRPLSSLKKEIKYMKNSLFHSSLKMTKVAEFDELLEQFHEMKQKVWDLLGEVEEKEKRKTELELEKLLFQINPHFIHNTLDTIRWLARSKGQTDIDHLISTLIKVLYYNMGKGGVSTIEKEIEALRDYVALQQARYDFQFDVRIHASIDVMDIIISRFILQPLVENSLYHGLRDDGVIEVNISLEDDRYTIIQVSDNGVGMTDEDIHRLMSGQSREQRQVGMGIGLYYVHRMIKAQFGEEAKLDIKSNLGQGTSMILRIPMQNKGGIMDVEGTGR